MVDQRQAGRALGPLYRALQAACKAVAPVEATTWCATAPRGRPSPDEEDGFWYAPLADVRAAGRPALLDQGLMLTLAACSVAPVPLDRDLRANMRFDLIHAESGGVLALSVNLPVARPGDFKDMPMAVAATVSHGWRIVLLQLLCIEVVPPGAGARRAAPARQPEPPAWEPAPEQGQPAPVLEQFTALGLSERLGWWCDHEAEFHVAEGRPRPRLGLADAWLACSGEALGDRLLTVLEQERLYFWLSEMQQRAEWLG